MEIRPLSPDYAVSPQIAATDIKSVAEAGFTTVICNRPDAENPPAQQSAAIRKAAEAAGLRFVFLPFTHDTLDAAMVVAQAEAMTASDGPVFAYCASGTRCSVVWSLTQAGTMPVDEIIAATNAAGYALEALRPRLEALAVRR